MSQKKLTVEEMLPLMCSIMRYDYGGYLWRARTIACSEYGRGQTPEEAMREALLLEDDGMFGDLIDAPDVTSDTDDDEI